MSFPGAVGAEPFGSLGLAWQGGEGCSRPCSALSSTEPGRCQDGQASIPQLPSLLLVVRAVRLAGRKGAQDGKAAARVSSHLFHCFPKYSVVDALELQSGEIPTCCSSCNKIRVIFLSLFPSLVFFRFLPSFSVLQWEVLF